MDAGSKRRGSRVLLALALVPFGAAVAAHAVGSTVQPAASLQQPSAVVFDQYLVDLGCIEDQNLVYAWFRFHNVSDETIRVVDLDPSCGCLNPQLDKREYAPGEAGEFYLRVRTANERPGRHEYTVRFDYSDVPAGSGASHEHSESETTRSETLSFRVTLPERKVSIEPKALAFYQLDGNATSQQIVVRDHRDRDEKFEVLRAVCDSELVTVVLDGPTDRRDHRSQTIHVSVRGEVPPGRHRETIEMHTNDATHAVLRVPLLIMGPQNGIETVGGERPAP